MSLQRLCVPANLLRKLVAHATSDGLLLALWKTGVWRLMVFLLIYSTGLAIIFPITPTLMTNGFASLAAGRHLDCTAYPPSASPRECVDAHATVVTWMSWTNFVSSSLLTFLCAPYVGGLSDRIGRKPFMLVGVALTLLPLAVIQLHLHDVLPIYWYYPASAAGGAVSSFTMTLTSVADLMEQKHRATAVGYLTSCFSLGMLGGPLLGGYMSVKAALWTCIALTVVTWLYVAVFVPECAPGPLARRAAAAAAKAAAAAAAAGGKAAPQYDAAAEFDGEKGSGAGQQQEEDEEEGASRMEEEQAAEAEALAAAEAVSLVSAQRHLMSGGGGSGDDAAEAEAPLLQPYRRGGRSGGGAAAAAAGGEAGGRLSGLSSGWSVIRHSSFYRRIAAIWVVVAMTWEGAGELLMQYLQYKLGYGTRDQAHVLTVLASGGLVVKLGLLALLVRWLGERRLLAFGLAAYAAECLALAAAPTKAAGLAAVSIGSLASVCWPALTALQTAGVNPAQQGAVFGALQAISSMASGLGPLLFAAVFRSVTRSDSSLPPMPELVWYMAAVMTAAAIALTLSLPDHPHAEQQQPQQQQQQPHCREPRSEEGTQQQQRQRQQREGGGSGGERPGASCEGEGESKGGACARDLEAGGSGGGDGGGGVEVRRGRAPAGAGAGGAADGSVDGGLTEPLMLRQ
ncbi:hypothetical protein PLESTM_001124900 [Pleodorina starrii]|nr:hypothetical protein PLESTM_001124900 [Pleodorina starrii]